jgi:hypothetical protein
MIHSERRIESILANMNAYNPAAAKQMGEHLDGLADKIEALWQYATHRPDCPQATGPYDLGELEPACTCGLDDLERGEVRSEIAVSLMLVLDHIDYTGHAASVNEMIGALLPTHILARAKAAVGKLNG